VACALRVLAEVEAGADVLDAVRLRPPADWLRSQLAVCSGSLRRPPSIAGDCGLRSAPASRLSFDAAQFLGDLPRRARLVMRASRPIGGDEPLHHGRREIGELAGARMAMAFGFLSHRPFTLPLLSRPGQHARSYR
jgi:hypothetical protein